MTDITTDQKLVRLLKDDGTWTEFEADWKRQCEQLGEDFDSYAGSTFSVISDLVEKEQKKAGVFGLKIGNSYSAMCQVNKAGLPKYDSPVLRTRYMTLSPEYDLTNKTISEYGDVLVALLAEVMGLAILDKELECRHVKFHLRSPADIPFFAAIGKGIKERDVFDAIETRGMWLYITRK